MKIQARKLSNAALFKSDRGDVPGWVLITLMTAGLVVVIWAFAAPALQGVFDEAMDRVVKF
ncbi:MAG: hypothetical protein RI929_278 [Actinomycetota bacterium]|jgi:F0F1-type ATP synthase membrane subunit b/b'